MLGALALAGFAVVGAVELFGQFGLTLDLVTAGVLAALLLLLVPLHLLPAGSALRFPAFLLFGTGATLVALAGVDSVWADAGIGRITAIWPSLIVGFVLFWALAVPALMWPFRRADSLYPHGVLPTLACSLGIAVLLAAVLPLGFATVDWLAGDEDEIPTAHALPSTLDVIVLRDDAATPPPASQTVADWTVHTYAGRVTREDGRDRIEWDSGAPPSADDDAGRSVRVLLLFPDGGGTDDLDAVKRKPEVDDEDPAGVTRWMRLAGAVTDAPIPTYAFLRSTDPDRLAVWQRALTQTGDASIPFGGAIGLGAIGTADTSTDLALRYGVRHPSADQDLALAVAHRPALYFDRGERLTRPLDIDAVVASGALRQCPRGALKRDACPAIHRSSDLRNDRGVLAFDPREVTAASPQSVIYAHVTHAGNDAPDAIYLDYWWYLPDNPTGAVGGALCGAGFTIAGRTCQDHQSDWEGMTVVLDAAHPGGRPLKVIYAQHEGSSSYTWEAAERQWDQEHVTGVDTAVRPLAFIAQGTHAAYVLSCAPRHCTETGARDLPKSDAAFAENGHDGSKEWREGNTDLRCNGQCVRLLPTDANGDRALWSAFDGNWGSQSCILRTICTKSEAPRSPGYQGRYEQPWRADRSFALDPRGRTVVARASCSERRPTAAELAGDTTLLALGDSFSSGQGAGDYECGTTSKGVNTCFRSHGAWPSVLAGRLRLVALPSLACSSAVSAEVRLDGRSHNGEAERDRSQVGRIEGYPKIITLTIGGNDVRFSEILTTCLVADCYARYHRPGGDLLDQRVHDLEPDLAETYAAIRHKAPQSRLVVSGYPRLFGRGIPDRRPVGGCAELVTVSGREATYLNEKVALLNRAIRRLATAAGATYADVEEALDGHEVSCDRGRRWINPPSAKHQLFPASFHPTDAGYRRLADVIRPQLSASAAP